MKSSGLLQSDTLYSTTSLSFQMLSFLCRSEKTRTSGEWEQFRKTPVYCDIHYTFCLRKQYLSDLSFRYNGFFLSSRHLINGDWNETLTYAQYRLDNLSMWKLDTFTYRDTDTFWHEHVLPSSCKDKEHTDKRSSARQTSLRGTADNQQACRCNKHCGAGRWTEKKLNKIIL